MTQNSSTSEKTHPPIAPPDPSETTCSTGKQQSWAPTTPPTPAESSSSTSTSQQTTHSNPQRYTSPPASTTATSTRTEESVWIFSRISGVLLLRLVRCFWVFVLFWPILILMIPLCLILHSCSRAIGRGMIVLLENGLVSMPCNCGMCCICEWERSVSDERASLSCIDRLRELANEGGSR